MDEILRDLIANVKESLHDLHINQDIRDGVVVAYNIINSYLVNKSVLSARLYFDKEISYIQKETVDDMYDEIARLMDEIVDFCDEEVKKNEANI